MPGVAWSGLVSDGCSWAPHAWRQSRTVPSASRSCPKWGRAGAVAGWPDSDWYPSRLRGTSPTPMIVHARFMRLLAVPNVRLRVTCDDAPDRPRRLVGQHGDRPPARQLRLTALEPQDDQDGRRHELLHDHLRRQPALRRRARAEVRHGDEPHEHQRERQPAYRRAPPKAPVARRGDGQQRGGRGEGAERDHRRHHVRAERPVLGRERDAEEPGAHERAADRGEARDRARGTADSNRTAAANEPASTATASAYRAGAQEPRRAFMTVTAWAARRPPRAAGGAAP